MGGHGGLNILPQKKWNVYNWDNRIKVIQNEKIISDELENRKNLKNEKIFKEKILSIKKGEVFNEEIYKEKDEIILKEKNRIFSDIMKRKNLEKQFDNNEYFENRFVPLKENDQLISFEGTKLKSEYEKNINSKNCDSDEEKNGMRFKSNDRHFIQKKKFEKNYNENSDITFRK